MIYQQIIIDGLKRQYDDRLRCRSRVTKTNNPEQLEKVLRQQIKTSAIAPLLWRHWAQSLMKHGEWREASHSRLPRGAETTSDAYDYA